MTTHKPKVKSELSYTPDAELIVYLKERLNLLKKQKELKDGEELAPKDRILKRNNDGKKVHYLNNYIFKSTASLTTFFDFIKDSPELQDDFKEDIQELLMSWRKNKPKSKVKAKSCYTPDADLIDFLKERLDLLKKQKRGERSTLKDSILKRNNDSTKVYVLNNYVFPSMANLITYFESIGNNPELQEDSEDELKELLLGWNKNDKSETPVSAFARLANATISWEYKKDPFNFRLSLIYAMQEAIRSKLPSFAKKDFHKNYGQFRWTVSEKMIGEDMERAISWAGFYARNTLDSKTQKKLENASRPVLF